MSRVEINADGRQVVVDHVGDLPYLIKEAMDAWRATETPKPTRGFTPMAPSSTIIPRNAKDEVGTP